MGKADITNNKMSVKQIIIFIICGIAMGVGAILPGISGGILCVIFGIYKPLMELLSNPVKGIKKSWKMFIFISVGWLIGFFVFANVIKFMFGASQIYTSWLFVGLIVGSFPALYKEAGKEGRNKYSIIAGIIGFILMFAVFLVVALLPGLNLKAGIPWFLFAGVMWGLSIIIPGMMSSTFLMSLGIYEDFNAGLAAFKLEVLIPWIIGMVITVFLLAKTVDRMFKKHYSVCFHAIVGILLASTLGIFPIFITANDTYAIIGTSLVPYTAVSVIISIVSVVIGFVVAFIFGKIKVEEE